MSSTLGGVVPGSLSDEDWQAGRISASSTENKNACCTLSLVIINIHQNFVERIFLKLRSQDKEVCRDKE